MRSESTSALGHPRLTNPTLGARVRAARVPRGLVSADVMIGLVCRLRALVARRMAPGARPGSAGSVVHPQQRAETPAARPAPWPAPARPPPALRAGAPPRAVGQRP